MNIDSGSQGNEDLDETAPSDQSNKPKKDMVTEQGLLAVQATFPRSLKAWMAAKETGSETKAQEIWKDRRCSAGVHD